MITGLLAALKNMTMLAQEAIVQRQESDDPEDQEMLDIYEAQYAEAEALIKKCEGV